MVALCSALPGRRLVLAGAASLTLAPRARAQAGTPAKLVMGGGPDGEVAQLVGTAMAAAASRAVPGLNLTCRVTETYGQNTRLLGAGEVNLGILQVDLAVNAYEGDGVFRGKPMPRLRALAVLYGSHMHIVTVAERKINAIRDLKGKRIGTNRAGSATEMMANRLLVASGVNRNADLAGIVNAPLDEMLAGLASGQIDALFYSSGIPTPPIVAFGARSDIHMQLVPHGELAGRVVARHGPVYSEDFVPQGTYPDQAAPYSHISASVVLAATEALPDALATGIVSAIWDKRTDLAQAHPDAQKFTLDAQRNAAAGIPWHPAAEAFWLAKGAVLA